MQASYVNPFIINALAVMRKTMQVEATQGKPALMNGTAFRTGDVSVAIGLKGQVKGEVTLRMEEDTACRVASTMLLGLSVPAMDEMALSALCELVNIIAGNATIDLVNCGFQCAITPPMVQTGEPAATQTKTLVVPIASELGEIRLAINARH